eukprot:2672253-Pyramimonas_sp.AAC.1
MTRATPWRSGCARRDEPPGAGGAGHSRVARGGGRRCGAGRRVPSRPARARAPRHRAGALCGRRAARQAPRGGPAAQGK